jgi:hypothetical protein
VRLTSILSGLREKVEEGFTTEFAEGTEEEEEWAPSPVFCKNVILRELRVRIVQECDFRAVMDAGLDSKGMCSLAEAVSYRRKMEPRTRLSSV